MLKRSKTIENSRSTLTTDDEFHQKQNPIATPLLNAFGVNSGRLS